MLAWGCACSNPWGGLPLSPPPCSERGVRTNIIQLRKQNAKRNIIEVRENMCFACTGEVNQSAVNQSDEYGLSVLE